MQKYDLDSMHGLKTHFGFRSKIWNIPFIWLTKLQALFEVLYFTSIKPTKGPEKPKIYKIYETRPSRWELQKSQWSRRCRRCWTTSRILLKLQRWFSSLKECHTKHTQKLLGEKEVWGFRGRFWGDGGWGWRKP